MNNETFRRHRPHRRKRRARANWEHRTEFERLSLSFARALSEVAEAWRVRRAMKQTLMEIEKEFEQGGQSTGDEAETYSVKLPPAGAFL